MPPDMTTFRVCNAAINQTIKAVDTTMGSVQRLSDILFCILFFCIIVSGMWLLTVSSALCRPSAMCPSHSQRALSIGPDQCLF